MSIFESSSLSLTYSLVSKKLVSPLCCSNLGRWRFQASRHELKKVPNRVMNPEFDLGLNWPKNHLQESTPFWEEWYPPTILYLYIWGFERWVGRKDATKHHETPHVEDSVCHQKRSFKNSAVFDQLRATWQAPCTKRGSIFSSVEQVDEGKWKNKNKNIHTQ